MNATISEARQFRNALPGDDLRDLVPNPKVILDCGAGHGFFAECALMTWPNAIVHSFEPALHCLKELDKRRERHFVHPIALGDASGKATLHLTRGKESNSLLEFLPGGPLESIHAETGTASVDVQMIDDWLNESCTVRFDKKSQIGVQASDVGLFKLDVQGNELSVFCGAYELLRAKPVIFCEVSFQQQYKDQPLISDVDSFLASYGYRRLYLYPSVRPEIWGDAIYVPEGFVVPESTGPIRLNIGAGDTVIQGFTPIDRRFGSEAYPLNYADESVTEIRCVHMLEHLSFREVPEALKEWHRVLRPGGRIRISVPDARKVATMRDDQHWQFYLMGGQTDENDFHKSAFDGEYLTLHLENAGFQSVKPWVSTNTDLASSDISLNLEAIKPEAGKETLTIRMRAIIGLPRIGWNDAWLSVTDAMKPFGIPIETHQGCFWGQNVQKAMERALKDGIDWLLTLDYDSMILPQHVSKLLDWLGRRPDIDAIAALQMRRGAEFPLFSVKGTTLAEMTPQPIQVDTAHFGLTLIRVDCLKDVPKPWLWAKPDENGEWGDNRRDDDITFWDKWKAAGKTVFVAPDVRIGHLELMVSEYDDDFKPRHFHVSDWWNRHARAGHCARTKKED